MRGMLPSALVAATLGVVATAGHDAVDPQLLAAIQQIRAIDNHSHAEPASDPGVEPAAALGAAPFVYPFRLRLDSAEYPEAWDALWGPVPAGTAEERARAALRGKWRRRRQKAESYPAWVLDRAGIEVAIVNVEQLGAGQAAPRFRWVPQADELLFPVANPSPEFQRILGDRGLAAAPPTLAEYESQVVTPTLERWKAAGALAVKLAVAYRRPLDFAAPDRQEAERVYARASAGPAPSAAEYKTLQDHLFHRVSAEAGRVGLAVHIHVGVGADPYFDLSGSRPALLEPALNDRALRSTRFVLVHGGWPFERETGVMLMKPNVYADFSAQTFLRSTRALAETLRAWLEWYPEKVLFGTDAYSEGLMGSSAVLAGWEEKMWLATRTSREALAIALTGMMKDGQVTRAQALELARLVLRGNAERLYGLPAAAAPAR